jgi:aerobic-type carbon monoxide dehydrogenase small subunit (CoxS/CutS family)
MDFISWTRCTGYSPVLKGRLASQLERVQQIFEEEERFEFAKCKDGAIIVVKELLRLVDRKGKTTAKNE